MGSFDLSKLVANLSTQCKSDGCGSSWDDGGRVPLMVTKPIRMM